MNVPVGLKTYTKEEKKYLWIVHTFVLLFLGNICFPVPLGGFGVLQFSEKAKLEMEESNFHFQLTLSALRLIW